MQEKFQEHIQCLFSISTHAACLYWHSQQLRGGGCIKGVNPIFIVLDSILSLI